MPSEGSVSDEVSGAVCPTQFAVKHAHTPGILNRHMRRCQQMRADWDGLGEDFKFARAEQEAEPDRPCVFSGLDTGIRADSLCHQFDKCRVGQFVVK